MRYTLETDGQTLAVEVDALGAGRYRVRVGDGPVRTLDAEVDGDLVHLVDGTASHALRLAARGMDEHGQPRQHVQLAGLDATLTVLDARAARRRASAASTGSGAEVVRSPMPGRVVAVLVKPGDAVTVGQSIAIVEAMKMENELRAEITGVVATVHVAAGDRVDGNATLVTLARMDGTK